jgi:hypothetical protein
MDLTLINIGISGLVVGFILSIILNVYSKSTANSYSYSLFGVNIIDLIVYSITLALGITIVLLSGYSVLVRDLQYPKEHPIRFTIETLLMGFLPSLIIFIMTVFRGYKITNKTFIEFTVLVVKFGLLHILFQFSGFYSSVFPHVKN